MRGCPGGQVGRCGPRLADQGEGRRSAGQAGGRGARGGCGRGDGDRDRHPRGTGTAWVRGPRSGRDPGGRRRRTWVAGWERGRRRSVRARRGGRRAALAAWCDVERSGGLDGQRLCRGRQCGPGARAGDVRGGVGGLDAEGLADGEDAGRSAATAAAAATTGRPARHARRVRLGRLARCSDIVGTPVVVVRWSPELQAARVRGRLQPTDGSGSTGCRVRRCGTSRRYRGRPHGADGCRSWGWCHWATRPSSSASARSTRGPRGTGCSCGSTQRRRWCLPTLSPVCR